MTWAARIPTLAGLRYPQASFVLDFASNYYRGSGAQGSSPSALPGYNFTRALAAYAEDTSGNLIQFASGVPRITNKGVLIEEGRTNLQTQSEFASGWSTTNSTITPNAGPAPNGAATAASLVETGATGQHVAAGASISKTSASLTYTGSVYVSPKGRTFAEVQLTSVSGGAFVYVNLLTGAVTNGPGTYGSNWSAATATVTPAAGGMMRIALTATNVTDTSLTMKVLVCNTGTSDNYTGDGTSGLYIWGGQVEQASFPTSYIPTTSASVTRPADVFKYTNVNAPSPITMAATASFSFGNQSAGTYEFVSLGSSFNDCAAILRRDVSGGYQGFARTGGVSVADVIAGGAPTATTNTLAFRNADNNFAFAKDGSILGTDVSGTAPTFIASTLGIGTDSWGSGSGSTNGYIQRLAIYPFAASDAQLQSISSGNF